MDRQMGDCKEVVVSVLSSLFILDPEQDRHFTIKQLAAFYLLQISI